MTNNYRNVFIYFSLLKLENNMSSYTYAYSWLIIQKVTPVRKIVKLFSGS